MIKKRLTGLTSLIRFAVPALVMVTLAGFPVHAIAQDLALEPPFLRAKVESGELPPMAERLPAQPKIVDYAAEGKETGRYGGRLTTLLGKARDLRMMTVYSYVRLIGFNTNFELEPDLLESFVNEQDRIFTLTLRENHRWSDGHPFTTEDFRYWWEDVATNNKLNEGAVDSVMLADGQMPVVTVIDERTIRYEWPAPNPLFPLSIAKSSPLYIYMPAHYMKKFHEKYADPVELARLVQAENVSDWSSLHTRRGRMYRQENPDLPVLEAWQNTAYDATQRAVFTRNPYFHRVDPQGQQLPYLDEIIINMASTDVIPAKAGAGESDLQARYIRFDNYTFLKNAEETRNFFVHLWRNGVASQLALYPNLNVADETWAPIVQDVRFRRALSLGINREELNQQLYFGLAKPSANMPIPDSPLYSSDRQSQWTSYDPDAANALLDEMGLSERAPDGIRLLPDGRRMEIIVESAGENTEETDALQLIIFQWQKLGIKAFARPLQLELLRRRFLAGETLMTITSGMNIGLAAPELNPEELAPVSTAQPNWPIWGQYTETVGTVGELPPEGPALELLELYREWSTSSTDEQRRRIWNRMLDIYSDQVFSIGIVGQTIQPVVVNKSLRNLPAEGVYSWMPTAYFGVYRPDTFWFENQ